MKQTVSEKIISSHTGRLVAAGDIAVVPVDGAMATDATAPFAIRAFSAMGGTRLWDPERVSLVLDHATPAPNERIAGDGAAGRTLRGADGASQEPAGPHDRVKRLGREE